MNILSFLRKRIKKFVKSSLPVKTQLPQTYSDRRFSKWNTLVHVKMRLNNLFRQRQPRSKVEWLSLNNFKLKTDSDLLIIQQVQQQVYFDELEILRIGKSIPNNRQVPRFDPFLDEHGILGGRLKHSHMGLGILSKINTEFFPPGQHYIFKLIVLYFYENIHQGRHLTDGVIRAAEY